MRVISTEGCGHCCKLVKEKTALALGSPQSGMERTSESPHSKRLTRGSNTAMCSITTCILKGTLFSFVGTAAISAATALACLCSGLTPLRNGAHFCEYDRKRRALPGRPGWRGAVQGYISTSPGLVSGESCNIEYKFIHTCQFAALSPVPHPFWRGM
jgi:hypothetical protein